MFILRPIDDSTKTEEEVFQEALTTVFENKPILKLDDYFPFMIQAAPFPLIEKTEDDAFQWPVEMCGRCYAEFQTVGNLRNSNCIEKPELLKGKPIGQYHCPDCGAMVMAGIPHPTICERCATRTHPDYD